MILIDVFEFNSYFLGLFPFICLIFDINLEWLGDGSKEKFVAYVNLVN